MQAVSRCGRLYNHWLGAGATLSDQPSEGPSGNFYAGKGWSFIRIRKTPEWIAAPLAILSCLILAVLFSVGVFLIFKLVERVWTGTGADTVPAASAALTAIAALFGAIFLTWRTVVAHWQARAVQQQTAIAKETHYTTLFTTAVEQLGATREVNRPDGRKDTVPNLEVRLGAIYAFERIAQDSERDYWPILEALAAYVSNRENAGDPLTEQDVEMSDKFGDWWDEIRPVRVDIQAAITAIGRRPKEQNRSNPNQTVSVSLTRANLQKANFSYGNFSHAQMNSAYLEAALFAFANLRDVNFGSARLQGADFGNALLDGTKFHFAQMMSVSFESASLQNVSFLHTRLEGASFSRARIQNVSFDRARFKEPYFVGTIFENVELSNRVLLGASLYRADLSRLDSLTTENLEFALGDLSTKLPLKFPWPKHWPKRILEQKEWRAQRTKLFGKENE